MDIYPKKTEHPAKFSKAVTDRISKYLLDLPEPLFILDPFAGVGGVHEFNSDILNIHTYGIELEPEWASQHDRTYTGDARDLVDIAAWLGINCIVTSPCYGNRMADHHNAKDDSKRITYKHKLGHDLSEGSAAGMQWGEDYRNFHMFVWMRCTDLIRQAGGGWFILNCKDHIRKDVHQAVTMWHIDFLNSIGWETVDVDLIDTKGMGFGANREKRAEEWVALLRYTPT